MDWVIDKNRPICPQIKEHICVGIATGVYQKNERLRSVRETALDAGVNPNTVQKAFTELERDGLIFSKVGSGWYVTDSDTVAKEQLDRLIREKTVRFLAEMQNVGVGREAIIEILRGVEA